MNIMKLIAHREGENGLMPFRTRRIFNIGTYWYFAVRDGKDCGPFKDMQGAKTELESFILSMDTKKPH